MKTMLLRDYISQYFGAEIGASTAFAESMGVMKQQVTKWLSGGWFVLIEDEKKPQLLSPKKELPAEIPLFKNVFEPSSNRPFIDCKVACLVIDFSSGEVDFVGEPESDLQIDSRMCADDYSSILKCLEPKLQQTLALHASIKEVEKETDGHKLLVKRFSDLMCDIKEHLYATCPFDEVEFVPDFSSHFYLK